MGHGDRGRLAGRSQAGWLVAEEPARLVRLLPRRKILRPLDAPELASLSVPGDDARDLRRAREGEVGIQEQHVRRVEPPPPARNVQNQTGLAANGDSRLGPAASSWSPARPGGGSSSQAAHRGYL